MRELLSYKILDNTVESYLLVIGAIALAFLFKRFVSKYLAHLLYGLIAKVGKKINKDAFCNLVVEPLEVFLLVLVVIVSLDQLNYPDKWNISIYKWNVSQIIDGLANGTIIIVFVWLCLRIIDFVATILDEKANVTRSQSDNQLIVFFKDFFKVILVIMGVLLLIRFVFNRDIGSLLTGLSIVGAAVALATRESLENLIASFIIFFDKPFVTGDTVKVHNFTGTIEKIGLRSTRIRTVDKTYISVPNKQMVDSIVDNISLRTQRKTELRLELKLSVTSNDITTLLTELRSILVHPKILSSAVNFVDTGKNANVIMIEYFAGMQLTEDEFKGLKEEINLAVIKLIESTGTAFATPNLDALLSSK